MDVVSEKREKGMIFRFIYDFDSKRGSGIRIHRDSSEFSSFLYFVEPSFSCPMCFKSFTKALFKEHAPFCLPTKLKFLSQSGSRKRKMSRVSIETSVNIPHFLSQLSIHTYF